ncbi:Ig-like domain-containing protein [Erwinia billingiae]|uniref:Ig-like domain-containing protein n=1 Tax=Erwinia billingiae TaxID=182337 RepID=UPI00320B7DF9
MTSPLHLLVVDGKTITKTASLPQTANGQPVHIKAIDGGKYLLSSGENQAAPDHIVVKRVGKDLQVFTQEGDDTPEIIIDGFYDHQGELSGMAADGTYHTYVNQDGSDRDAFLLLDDSGASTLVLGSESTGGLEGLAAAGGLTTGMIALGALAALAALTGIAIAASNRGGHHDDNGVAAPKVPGATSASDNVGSVQGKIAQHGATDDTRPVLDGQGTPANIINVYDNGNLIGSTVVAANGSWTFQPTSPLGEGPHDISFSEKNSAGVESAQSAPISFTVDLTPPTAAEVISVTDGKNQDLTHGGLTNNGDVEMSGKGATPGDVVKLYDGDKLIGSTIVDADGNWTVPGTIVGDGEHDLSVGITDPAGNEGPRSPAIPVDLDTTAPIVPTPTLTDGTGLDLSHGGVTNNGSLDMSGTGGTEGDIVKLYDGDTLVGSTTVGKDGNWTIPGAIGEGTHDLSASYTDPAGNESAKSAPIAVEIDTTPPAAPTPHLEDGNHLDLTAGGPTNNGSLEMSGTGTAGDIVRLYDGDTLIGSDTVGPDGTWTVTGPISGDGIHPISANFTDPAGNVGEKSAPIAVDLDTVAPAAPTPHLEDGNDQDLTTGGLTNNGNLDMSGTGGTKGDIVKLYDGDTLLGSAVVGDGGVWTVPGAISGDGTHPISASFTDPAGNESLKSAPIAVDLDTTAPAAPTPTLEDGNDKDLTAGGVTNNGNLDMSGTGGVEGDIVKLYDGDTLIGSASVGPGGVWTVPGAISGDGTHPISASFTDPAGNESAKSAPIAVGIDTVAPLKPEIANVADNTGGITDPLLSGDVTDETKPVFSGKTDEAGLKVELRDQDGNIIGTTVTDKEGNWTVSPDLPLTNGDWAFTVRLVDAAGNSTDSDSFGLHVDNSIPAAGTIDGLLDNVGTETGSMVSGTITDDTTPTLNGSGPANGQVVLMNDGKVLATVDVDASGKWNWTPTADLPYDNYHITAQSVSQAGVVGGTSGEFDFKLSESIVEDFSSFPAEVNIASGTHMNGSTFTYTSNSPIYASDRVFPALDGRALQVFGNPVNATMSWALDDPAYKFSMMLIGVQSSGAVNVNFYDTDNNLLETRPLPKAAVGTYFTWEATDGALLGRVEIVANNVPSGVAFDNIEYYKANAADLSAATDISVSSTGDEFAAADADSGIMAAQSSSSDDSDTDNIQHHEEQSSTSVEHQDELTSINGQPLNTLVIDQAEQPINLSNIAHQQPEVDVIDITAKGDTTLNLNVNDVLAMGSEDLFLNTGSTQLMIKGDAGNTVNLETVNGDKAPEQWNAQGEVTMDGTTYNVYQNSDHEVDVLIQQGVQVHQQ